MAKQQVRTDPQRIVWFILGAVVCAVIAFWAYRTIHWGIARWGIAAIAAFAAYVVVTYGRSSSGIVDCPSCDLVIHRVALRDNPAVLCPHCKAYASGSGGTIDATPPDFIAPRPAFAAALPQPLAWPAGCCVCGESATRMIDVQLVEKSDASFGTDLAVRAATLGVLKAVNQTTYRLEVPHCANHRDGVSLDSARGPAGIEVVIAFRSYPFFREFVAAHHVEPRPLLVNM